MIIVERSIVFSKIKNPKKKHEISLKPAGAKDLKELKENLDFDIE